MARKTLRRLLESSFGSEWDQLVRRIHRRDARRFLIFWNRGLGDVALGLAGVVDELRRRVRDAHITILTRQELAEAFTLLPVDRVLVEPSLQRRDERDVRALLLRLGVSLTDFDLIIGRPDPTHWFREVPKMQPRLRWPARGDALATRFDPLFDGRHGRDGRHGDRAPITIAVHVSSETGAFYKYRKDWPVHAWHALFARLQARHPVRFVLLGHTADTHFADFDCIDLRGRTSLLEVMSVIRHRCPILIAPDSGLLTMTYYLDTDAPIGVVSLWADPRQGILKQGVPSPNPQLRHRAIVAPDERIENITTDSVMAALIPLLAPLLEQAPDQRRTPARQLEPA